MACQVDLGTPPDAGACLAAPDVFALGASAPDGGTLPAVWDSYLVAEQCNTRRCHDFQDGHGTLRLRAPEAAPAAGTPLDAWPTGWRENYLSAIQFLDCESPLESRLLTMPEGAGNLHPPGPVVRDRAAAATEISGMDRRAALTVAALALAAPARAEVTGDVRTDLRVFVQPAASDALLIVTPVVSARARPKPWLAIDASYLADVVTGATMRTYGSPDVVTSATQFSELRHEASVDAEARVGPAALSAGYSYGTESDYRTHDLRAGVKLDLAQHDTIVAASYGHSWNRVCDLAQASLPVTLRQPLDSSRGCFAGTPGLTEESLALDSAEVSLTQTLTPRLVGALVGTYDHADGFQSSPYRRVRLSGGLLQAQESHPRLRDRGAVTLRLRWALARWHAVLGVDARAYRDSWGVGSLMLEALYEQPISARWRIGARARGYAQTGAAFYRDAGNPDSYEKAGPVGLYFTADQELAPLADLLIGPRFLYHLARPPGRRLARVFSTADVALTVDYFKIFALTPDPPNAARAQAWATALVASASVSFTF